MPKYILIAGVNGAGKSTLYHILDNLHDMPRINIDEIVRDFGDWRNPSELCGKSIIKSMKKAKCLGYQIEMHYVGVDSVEIAKARVKERVKNGGHGIPDIDIQKRYLESFSNLKYIMSDCDTIFFYDNTKAFNCFAVYRSNGHMIIYPDVPAWFQMVME